MKQFMYLVLTAVALLSCFGARKRQQPDSIYVTAIVDITDHRQVYPKAESILPFYNFNTEENSEAAFRICPVTDRELNPDIEFHLPNDIETEKSNSDDDPDFRKKVIIHFFDSIRKTIEEFNTKVKSDTSVAHSECFKSISNELQNLAQHKGSKAILLVYSDLQENSAFFNCYSPSSQRILQSFPEKVAAVFEKTRLLPERLNNITVSFVYDPVSRDDDIRFMAMLKVYKKLLLTRGAKVTVSASNPIYVDP